MPNLKSKLLQKLTKSFYPYAKKTYGFDRDAKIHFVNDAENAEKPFGKTAYYNPQTSEVTVFTTGRHIKDIMRSVSHELVHHAQNCRGAFDGASNVGEQGYAQNDSHLREMEREAYEQGNLCFRDWEDTVKSQMQPGAIYEGKDLYGHKHTRLNHRLLKSWGFINESKVVEGMNGFPNMEEWWTEEPREIMSFVYWLKGQIPPSDPEKLVQAWDDLVAQLSKKHPPTGEVQTIQIMKELDDDDTWGSKYYSQTQFEQKINPTPKTPKPQAQENGKKGLLVENNNLFNRQEDTKMNINKYIAEEIVSRLQEAGVNLFDPEVIKMLKETTKPVGGERINNLRWIASNLSEANATEKVDGIPVSQAQAQELVTVYDALNETNKARFNNANVSKLLNFIGSTMIQEDDGDEDEPQGDLSPAQKELDLDDDGKIEPSDLAGLRSGKEDEDVGDEVEDKKKDESLRKSIEKMVLAALSEGSLQEIDGFGDYDDEDGGYSDRDMFGDGDAREKFVDAMAKQMQKKLVKTEDDGTDVIAYFEDGTKGYVGMAAGADGVKASLWAGSKSPKIYDPAEAAAYLDSEQAKADYNIQENVIDGDKPERMWSSVVDNTPMKRDGTISADELIAVVVEENPDIMHEEVKAFLDALVQQKSLRLIPDEDFGDEYSLMSEGKYKRDDKKKKKMYEGGSMAEYGKIDAEDGNPPSKIGQGDEAYMEAYNAVLMARGEDPLPVKAPDQKYLDALHSGALEEDWQDDPMAGVEGDEHMNQLKFTIEDVLEANPGAGEQEIMQAVMAQPGVEGNYAPEEIMAAIEDFMGMDPMEETVDDQYAIRATALNERLMRQWFKIKQVIYSRT